MHAAGLGSPPRFERAAGRLVARATRVGWLRRFLLSPVVALPGYWFATACALVWGTVLSAGRIRRVGSIFVARSMPRWAFGRGGTTIGAVYLTCDGTSPTVLEHEAVHRNQWRRYGLAFIALYVAAGQDALHNRFEQEAGLEKGGYR